MRTDKLLCALLRDDASGASRPVVILEILDADFFQLRATRCLAFDPHRLLADQVQAERWRSEFTAHGLWETFGAAARQIHKAVFGTDCVNPEDDYSTYVVPLDAAAADFPWRDIGRRRSKETRRGEQHHAVYSPQLALTRVATFGDDEGEEAGEYRSDGGWISVSAGRPYVPPHLSLEEATERLRRHMPNGRYVPKVRPRDRFLPGEKMEGEELRKRYAQESGSTTGHGRKRKRKASVCTDVGRVIFVSPSPPSGRDGRCFDLTPPSPWGLHPVVVKAQEQDVAPLPELGLNYLRVQSVLEAERPGGGGPEFRIHSSQALSFHHTFAARWAAHSEERADLTSDEAASFRAAMGAAIDHEARRTKAHSPGEVLDRVFCAGRGIFATATDSVPCATLVVGEMGRCSGTVPPYLREGSWRASGRGE